MSGKPQVYSFKEMLDMYDISKLMNDSIDADSVEKKSTKVSNVVKGSCVDDSQKKSTVIRITTKRTTAIDIMRDNNKKKSSK
jgi:hypothetical protein